MGSSVMGERLVRSGLPIPMPAIDKGKSERRFSLRLDVVSALLFSWRGGLTILRQLL
jgi:hypothetical protein